VNHPVFALPSSILAAPNFGALYQTPDDYLNDLYQQVRSLKNRGEAAERISQEIRMEKYSDFRQYPKYHATFSDNAATIYEQLERTSRPIE
jgi:hypothetical protein